MRTKGLRYECLECDWAEIVSPNDHRLDGRVCKKCGGHISPTGYVTIGVDLASGPDRTGYPPRPLGPEKNKKGPREGNHLQ